MKIDKFLKSSPLFHIYLLSEKIFSPFQDYLKKEGVTFIQSMILTSMYFEEKSVNPNNLATTLRTTPSNISHSIKYLCRKGLVQKNMNKADARKVDLKLTAKGNKKVFKLISLYNKTQDFFEEGTSEKTIMTWNNKSSHLIEIFTSVFN